MPGDTTVRDRSKGSNPKALKLAVKKMGAKYKASKLYKGDVKNAIGIKDKATKKTMRQSTNIEDATGNKKTYFNTLANTSVKSLSNPRLRQKTSVYENKPDANTRNANFTTNGKRQRDPVKTGLKLKNIKL